MKRSTALVMVALILLTSLIGQAPVETKADKAAQDTPATATPAGKPELTAADLDAFLDGLLPQQLARENIAGATVSVVKDGKLLFAKGYGYSDVANKKPVLPDTTLFRPGSISKLFTWTAVMQLQEQGNLDLDRDVNEYLDFKIPEAFGKPITLKNIMTHTPGFEEAVKDLFAVGADSPDLGAYLKTHIPQRVYPPGTVPAYSNYATALAGYIVERVSGKPFAEYIDTNIFKPLGMTHSTFAQPLPQNLAGDMSNGYRLGSDEKAESFEVVVPFPAGSLSSTSADMAKFMLAHLQNGKLGDATILRPETAELMHSRLFALDDAANAMCYGFYEESKNGHRIIGHGGDTIAFHSDLHLILDSGVGFFISYNSAGKGEASPRTMVFEAFLDRYFPYTPPAEPTLDSAKTDAQAVAGRYISSRRSETSFLKVASILGEATVTPREDGTIQVAGLNDTNGQPKTWREVAPMKFRDVNGQDVLVFKPDANGVMQVILPYPFMIFQRVGLYENSGILLPVLVISLLIMVLSLLLAPIAWVVRRRYAHKLDLSLVDKLLRFGVWITFALDLIFVIALVSFVTYALSHIELLGEKGTPRIHLIQAIGIVGAIGTLIVLFNAVKTWMSGRRIWGKLGATILVLACFGFLWFAFASNLLMLRSNY